MAISFDILKLGLRPIDPDSLLIFWELIVLIKEGECFGVGVIHEKDTVEMIELMPDDGGERPVEVLLERFSEAINGAQANVSRSPNEPAKPWHRETSFIHFDDDPIREDSSHRIDPDGERERAKARVPRIVAHLGDCEPEVHPDLWSR